MWAAESEQRRVGLLRLSVEFKGTVLVMSTEVD
jgi:hypothetical protein